MSDVDTIISDSADLIAAYALDLDEVRDALVTAVFGASAPAKATESAGRVEA